MKNYKEFILETAVNLVEIRHQLFENLLNIAMSNELSDINEVFEMGDTYTFELNHFNNSSDVNVNLIVDLIKDVEKTIMSFCNLNNLDIDDFL